MEQKDLIITGEDPVKILSFNLHTVSVDKVLEKRI